ncbi:disease resistance protein RGA5-like isoform X3 [Miscanthus floridulus]|uniref:disease resistance protein RGA5-like isoform X3 n=1 Tax=Miscanthus floridulus TaxID=154761 RepID=UPI003459BBBB
MDVATGAVSTLLPMLGDLLTREYQLQASVRDDVAFLKAELESMEAALLRISEAPADRPPDVQDRLWAREVRELSHDVEDCVEAFLVRLHHHHQAPPPAPPRDKDLLQGLRGLIDRGIGLLRRAKIRRDMGAVVRDIKRRVVEVGERRVRYKVDGVAAAAKPGRGPQASDGGLRLSALYAAATELVGTQARSRELVQLLMVERDEASNRLLKTVSVVGFGGLGKTTLARIVYEELKGQFDCAALVSISHNPDMEKVFRDMLCQLDKNRNTDIAMWGEAQLIEQLREFLRDKSYFIVIDDIWSCSVWNTVRHAFIENHCESRIIMTTRILDVAKQANSIYELRPLSPADSRKLFYQRIFGTEDAALPNHLAEVSENILKKCGGVPLAVITVASLLATKMRKENTDKYWYQVYQSMGFGLEESTDVKDMRRILSISYYDLPLHLKTFLLYLTLYSEDNGIIVEKVIYKLIGEGIIRKHHGKTLYEAGEDYFEDLINRSIIQPMLFNHGSKVWSCFVHDMMLDLIASVSEEENLLQALGGSQTMCEPTSKIRRLFLQNMKVEDVKKVVTMNLSHLRSLTVSSEAFTLLPNLSSFPIIRVLDLYGCTQVDNSHCKHICNLYHLRYLKLSLTSITEIPNKIGNLQLLQFLDLNMTNIKALPPAFVQLRKLEFLCVDNRTRLPECLGNLISLQKLSPCITIRSPTMLCELSRLTELRRLMLRFDDWDDESYEEPFVQCLSNLVNLESLQIFDCHNGLGSNSNIGMLLTPGPQQLRSMNIGPGTVGCVPRWMPSLFALSALDITLLTLQEEDLQVLGSIPSLRSLYIWVKEHRKDRHKRLAIGSDDCPFRCLTKFRIGPGAMEVEFAAGGMLMLRTVRLDLHVRHTLDQFGDFECGLESLCSLDRAVVHMNCYGAELEEVEEGEASIRKALDLNHKRPTLELEKHGGSWRSG